MDNLIPEIYPWNEKKKLCTLKLPYVCDAKSAKIEDMEKQIVAGLASEVKLGSTPSYLIFCSMNVYVPKGEYELFLMNSAVRYGRKAP